MKRMLLPLLSLLAPAVYAQDHADHAAAASANDALHDHAAMPQPPPHAAPEFADAIHVNRMEHGGMLNYLLLGERFEQQVLDGADALVWEAQGWYGGDYQKLWMKTEGSRAEGGSGIQQSELQVLYSRAVLPFWDLQLGLRHDTSDFASRNHAVLGLMGLAPYWFEIDAAAFVSDEGKASARIEVEYELRLTQKLLLQPRLELNHAFSSDEAAGVEQGASDSSFGLRLRYEFIREFAPYVGVEWDLGSDRRQQDSRVVAGVRFWY